MHERLARTELRSSRARRLRRGGALVDRFGLGRFNTEEEVDYVADLVTRKVEKLREMSPLYEMHKEGIYLKTVQWAAH